MEQEELFGGGACFTDAIEALRSWTVEQTAGFLGRIDADDPMPMHEIAGHFADPTIAEEPAGLAAYVQYLERDVLPHVSHLASPGYFGHMTSGLPAFMPELARLVTALNQNVMKAETSRALTFLERQMIGAIHRELFGGSRDFYDRWLQDPAASLGFFTSGGTMANISALRLARERALPGQGSLPKRLAQTGLSGVAVIGSELLHYSFRKGTDLLGMELLEVPAGDDGRVRARDVRDMVHEAQRQGLRVAAIIGAGGTTDAGSVDPLRQLAAVANECGAHFHVDAAWGGGLILAGEGARILDGIGCADTVTIDGHKQFMLPIGAGMLFIRDPQAARAVAVHAPYAVREDSIDLGRFTIEGTRAAAALYLHAGLTILGRSGYRRLLDDSLDRARYFSGRLKAHPRFELALDPVMNIVLYRLRPSALCGRNLTPEENRAVNRFNTILQKRQRDTGRGFVSRTTRRVRRWSDEPSVLLRAVMLNPRTRHQDIDALIEEQAALAGTIEREGGF